MRFLTDSNIRKNIINNDSEDLYTLVDKKLNELIESNEETQKIFKTDINNNSDNSDNLLIKTCKNGIKLISKTWRYIKNFNNNLS